MDANEPPLTAGQLEVRRIIGAYLGEYVSLGRPSPYGDVGRAFFLRVRDAAAANSTVRQDALTGIDLEKPDVSTRYLFHLAFHAQHEEELDPPVLRERTHLYAFPFASYGELARGPCAYHGGAKPYVTYSVLFGLAEGKRQEVGVESLRFYSALGLVEPHGDGTHRALAHYLWGADILYASKISVIHDFDADANAYFKMLDSIVGPEYSVGALPVQMHQPSLEEAEELHSFLVAQPELVTKLKTYLEDTYSDGNNSRLRVENIILYAQDISRRRAWWSSRWYGLRRWIGRHRG